MAWCSSHHFVDSPIWPRWTTRLRTAGDERLDGGDRGGGVVALGTGDHEAGVQAGGGGEPERLDEPGEVLALFLGADGDDVGTSRQPGDRRLGGRRGDRERCQVDRHDPVGAEQSPGLDGTGVRGRVDECPARRGSPQHLAGAGDDGPGAFGVGEEPAVVHRDHPRQPARWHDVVRAVDEIGATETEVEAGRSTIGPHPVGERRWNRHPPLAVAQPGPGTDDVRQQFQPAERVQRVARGRDGMADPGAMAVQRPDIEGDAQRSITEPS